MSEETLQQITESFVSELAQARAGKKNSLAFIRHHLSPTPLAKDKEVFQVLVIGGSMCKNALVKKENNTIKILKLTEKVQPPFVTQDDFFEFFQDELAPAVTTVALNFAYPLQPVFHDGVLDGTLLHGTKENTFAGLPGKAVGHTISDYVQQQTGRKLTISVANDTICLLLSGLIKTSWDHLAAAIVGTGFNMAVFLRETEAVNLESGNFTNFPQSDEGKELDKVSASPGKQLFEKEVSGAYVYRRFNALVKKHNLSYHEVYSTWEVKKLALGKIPDVSKLARSVIEDSASLVACQIAGVTRFFDRDMTFIMDGSFFWGEKIYKECVESCLKILVPTHTVTFLKMKDTTIVGAAKLVA